MRFESQRKVVTAEDLDGGDLDGGDLDGRKNGWMVDPVSEGSSFGIHISNYCCYNAIPTG